MSKPLRLQRERARPAARERRLRLVMQMLAARQARARDSARLELSGKR
jgi:hypothetical protein